MRFRKDNRIKYGQDHFYCRGLPSGIDFTVEPFQEGMYKLTGYGYGVLGSGESYGCGALYVYGLTSKQRKRFEKEIRSRSRA